MLKSEATSGTVALFGEVLTESTDGQAQLVGCWGHDVLTLVIHPDSRPTSIHDIMAKIEDLGYEIFWDREDVLDDGRILLDVHLPQSPLW